MIEKIVTGGQTGVDRAGLDAAIDLNINYGGWCPKGRIDEKGIIPDKYKNLVEIPNNIENEKENYDTRTKMNIRDSDATLIFLPCYPIPLEIQDGTLLTINEVSSQNKPYLLINLKNDPEENSIIFFEWIRFNNVSILNIAGPRESNSPGIYKNSYDFLSKFLPTLNISHSYSM